MNLITFDKMEPENGYMLLRDFRKEDNNKILILLSDMLKKLKLAKDQFSYTLQVKKYHLNYDCLDNQMHYN